MVTGLETLGHQIDNASAARGQQTEAASVAARDAYNVDSHQAVAGRAEALNTQLEQSGLIPGLHIDGIVDENTVRIRNDQGGTVNARIEGDSLRYSRPGANGTAEAVNIDLANGRELVSHADGSMDIRGARQAAEVIKVDAPNASGDRVVHMPDSQRQYTMTKDGQIKYDVKPNDNLWTVATDVARIQGYENPTAQQISGIVQEMSHVGTNGNADQIRAGEQITFGKGAKNPNDQIDFRVPGQIRDLGNLPAGVEGKDGKFTYKGAELPNVPSNAVFTPGENGSFSYTDANTHKVTVFPPNEAAGHHVPVVQTDIAPGHVEYREGTRSVWTTNNGANWYARSDGGQPVGVYAPWSAGLARGEIRTIAGDGKEYILGGKATNKDGWG
ncbi:MAG: hypothetical protein C0507_00470 [Cyanobacteria bacterium PR.3.49]|nr:hypothetical protein [Cyanobacteria bacterium PR.3.49]